jgi:small-conductance mechanosensitive channel
MAQLAQDATETPQRPLSDWVRTTFGDGRSADVIEFLIEPALQIVMVVVIIVIAKYLANRLIDRIVREMKTPDVRLRGRTHTVSSRRATRADALGTLLRSVANVVLLTIGVFMVLGVFGINLAPLIAGAGVIGLAIGFGAQDLVSDFIAGVFMLAEDQYGIGDVIDADDGIVGVVEGISLRTTRVRDVSGTLWHVPNGQISRIGNMSQEWARTLLDVGVSYDTDIDRASEVIRGVAVEMAEEEVYAVDFLDEPEIWGVQNLGADSVDIRLVIKTTPGSQWKIGRELRRRIKYALDGADIEIPFPQRTVWLRTDTTGTDTPLIDVASGTNGQDERD